MQFTRHAHPDLSLHLLATDKFKTNTLVLNLQRPLTEGLVTRTALVPYVLTRGSTRYPSVREMQAQLDHLYGSYLNADVYKLGERHVMQFRLEVPNGKYLPGRPKLLKEAISFLHEMITQPVIEGKGFKESFVSLEKDALRKRVEGIFNNKAQYARMRCTEAMCPDEPYRLYSGGRIEDLPTITPELLYQEYLDLLVSAPMDMYIVGDIEPEAVTEELNQVFRFPGRAAPALDSALKTGSAGAVKTVVDRHDVNQGQLVLGLRTPITYAHDDYLAMLMYNGVLGAFAHSKLFVNVRERESLAYSARSRYDSMKGLIFVQAGINIEDHDRALAVIKEQFAAMEAGDISDQELDQTRAMALNTYREAYDSPGALINLAFESEVAGLERPIEALAAEIPKITREDIVRVAKTLQLDTVYFLRDKEAVHA
ncbi:MAG: albE [Cyanobacteria bacterium RYN_339]|nr:albE [Cyanobacteria bacterium RYN_339]